MLTAVLRALGLVHGSGLDNRCQLGFGIPLIRKRFLCRHHKSFGLKLFLPSIQRGGTYPAFLADLRHTLVIRWHHFLDDLSFELGTVGWHCSTPSAPGVYEKEKSNYRTTSVTEGDLAGLVVCRLCD